MNDKTPKRGIGPRRIPTEEERRAALRVQAKREGGQPYASEIEDRNLERDRHESGSVKGDGDGAATQGGERDEPSQTR